VGAPGVTLASLMAIRLAAFDVDGTLLDPYGKLTDAVCAAVDSLRRAGVQVVLCTGRRFRTSLPIAQRLSLSGPIVCNNGVLVKDIESGKTLQHRYLPHELYGDVLALMRGTSPPMVYVDEYHEGTDLITERVDAAHEFQREYLADNTEFSRVVEDLATARPEQVIMMSAMADETTLAALRARAAAELGERVRTHSLINKNYRGGILEFLSPASGKWAALSRVAAGLGITPHETAAIGDDSNDAEMIRHAGLGIAMGNAVESAREHADLVVRSNAEGGAIEAIEQVLLAR
jgi:Cof subfamily protein (haloacid dehalogenase superfamily)